MKFGVLAKMGMDATAMQKGISTLNDKFKNFGKAIGGYVSAGVKIAATAVAGFAVKGLKDIAEFDNGMQEVFTLLPSATKDSMDKMKTEMRDLAVVMGVDVMDSVDALYQAISAGIDPNSAVAFIGQTAKLSIAGVSSLEDAVSAVTTVLNGYSLGVEDTQRVSDVLFSTVKIGVTNLTELAGAVGKVTPIAASLGITFEEVGAMFAVMTKQMGAGKADEAGTAIQAMLSELSKETSLASRNFKRLSGTSFPEFVKNGGTVKEALGIMAEGAKEANTDLKNMFSGVKAGQAALMLFSKNGDMLSVAFNTIVNDTGSVQRGFETMEQSVGRQFDKMKSAGHELGMQMGNALLPIANQIIPALTNGFKKAMPAIQDFADEFPAIMNGVMSAMDALVDIVIVVGTYVAITKLATASQAAFKAAQLASTGSVGGFKTAMKALSTAMAVNPWGLAIAGVVALGLAIKGLIDVEKEQEAERKRRADERKDKAGKENQKFIDEIEKLTAGYNSAKNALKGLNAEEDKRGAVEKDRDTIKTAEEELRLMELKLKNQRKFASSRALSEDEFAIKKKEIIKRIKEEATGYEDVERINARINGEISLIIGKMKEQKELEVAIKEKAEEVKNLKKQQAEAEKDILKTQQEVNDILKKAQGDYVLNNSEVGQLVLKVRELKQLEIDKNILIRSTLNNRNLEKGSASALAAQEQNILNKRQDIVNLLEGALKDARQAEKVQVDALIIEMQTLFDQESDRADKAGANAKAKEDEVAALRDELKVAEDALEPLKKFFQQDFKGKITPNYAEMHREFKRLKDEGKLPDNVDTLNDFKQMLTDQAVAAKTTRDNIIEDGQIAMADAKALRAEEQLARDAAEVHRLKIVEEKKKQAKLEEALIDKQKKTAEELAHETMAMEQALKKFTDTLNTNPPLVPKTIAEALNGQMDDLDNISEGMTELLQKNFGYGDGDENANREATQKKIKDSMVEAVDYLAGFFINQ